jgi:hypothetical protein
VPTINNPVRLAPLPFSPFLVVAVIAAVEVLLLEVRKAFVKPGA